MLLLALCTANAVYISYRYCTYKRGNNKFCDFRHLLVIFIAKDRRRREEDSEIEIEDVFEEEQEIAGGVLNDRPSLTAGGEHIAMNGNSAYSTVARDRENETMREREDITEKGQLEVIYEQPEQTTGRQSMAMNVDQVYSTVTRDRRCKEDGAERESGDIQIERLQLETVEMTRNPAEGEQIAMNVNQSYSTVARDRRCKEDGTERESGDMPNKRLRLETVELIQNQEGGEQIAIMNDNMAYSTVARDKRQRESEAEMESGNLPEEGLQLEPVEVMNDKPEQLATDEELFDNTAYSEQAGVICDRVQNEKVLEKTASAERQDWCDSMERGKGYD